MSQSDAPHAARLNETQARQASWGRPVFWVLLVSLILAGAAMLAVWAFNARDLSSVGPARNRLPPVYTPMEPKQPSPRDL